MTATDDRTATDTAGSPAPVPDVRSRLVDHWFPCAAVDAAVGTPRGSGRNEKAIFPWFASRPIAQARAAVLTTLLPDDYSLHTWVEDTVLTGNRSAFAHLARVIEENYGGRQPVVVDIFSGRGIIPLEAARVDAKAVGTDLSPVATLAGRLLADWPLRDWDAEPALPFGVDLDDGRLDVAPDPRLAATPTASASGDVTAYKRYVIELANRSITSPDTREQVWQLLREFAKVIDVATPADHQLLNLSVTLTTAEGHQGAIEQKANQAGARVRVEEDDF